METRKRKYLVTIISDEEGEDFSPSSCGCLSCLLMHSSNAEWDTFVPTTVLQKKMKAVVKKLERDIKERKIRKKIKLNKTSINTHEKRI
jgi:hypothetical protein